MITRETTYKLAFEKKEQERSARQNEYQRLLNEAYQKEPRLKEIETAQSALGAELALKALGNPSVLPEMQKRLEELSAQKQKMLAENGVRTIPYSCNVCKDTGYQNGKICRCIHQLASKIAISRMNEQMPLTDSRFEDFKLSYYPDKTDANGSNPRRRMSAIFKALNKYAEEFDPKTSPNLLLLGQAGLGKTHLTMSILSVLLEKGFLPVYGSAENLFDTLEKEKFSGENRGAYENMLEADLLVIDDLGAEMSTSFTRSALYNLINSRLLSRKPVIINTNLSMKEIESRYSARISSRLIGEFEAYKFIGDDIRQLKAIQSKGKQHDSNQDI